jgi:dipeptide/tripeptide permease
VKERLLAFFRNLAAYQRSFWVANVSELFERIAFYGTTSLLVVYLTKSRGIEETAAYKLNGTFGLLVYGLPVLSGFIADFIGYRRAMMLAYTLLAAGYFAVGQMHSLPAIAGALVVVAFGASLIKPTITGTVQKTCTEAQRSVGFSIYYTLVNVGGFLGPNLTGQVADVAGVDRIFYLSAGSAVIALILVIVAFREPAAAADQERKGFGAFLRDFGRVVTNARLMFLFLFVAGFWSMFFQFYGPLPTYLTDQLGFTPSQIGFVISLDALAVVCLQVVVGYLTRKLAASRAILLGVLLSSAGLAVIGLHASIVAVALGILVFALGEMTYSAHFYKYLGDMAPPGQVGMYMGFAFLPIALGSFFSGHLGSLIAPYFRDVVGRPRLMWFAFAGVGVVSAIGIAVLTWLEKPKGPIPVAES